MLDTMTNEGKSFICFRISDRILSKCFWSIRAFACIVLVRLEKLIFYLKILHKELAAAIVFECITEVDILQRKKEGKRVEVPNSLP